MSLYNMMMQTNPAAGLCLGLLRMSPTDIPRLRDAWLSDDGKRITILTRTGGGNREAYQAENAAMADRSGFVADTDDDYDTSYARFTYEVPEGFQDDTAKIAQFFAASGRGEFMNGPGHMVTTVVHAVGGHEPPTRQLSEDDPVVIEGFEAWNRLVSVIQGQTH